jgi:hypothetical protein
MESILEGHIASLFRVEVCENFQSNTVTVLNLIPCIGCIKQSLCGTTVIHNKTLMHRDEVHWDTISQSLKLTA